MSRTDLDPTTLAASLRRMAGDGSVEWVCEPMQTRVLLDVADLLDENAKLREFARRMADALGIDSEWCDTSWCDTDCMVEFGCQPAYCGGETCCPAWAKLRELKIEVEP